MESPRAHVYSKNQLITIVVVVVFARACCNRRIRFISILECAVNCIQRASYEGIQILPPGCLHVSLLAPCFLSSIFHFCAFVSLAHPNPSPLDRMETIPSSLVRTWAVMVLATATMKTAWTIHSVSTDGLSLVTSITLIPPPFHLNGKAG